MVGDVQEGVAAQKRVVVAVVGTHLDPLDAVRDDSEARHERAPVVREVRLAQALVGSDHERRRGRFLQVADRRTVQRHPADPPRSQAEAERVAAAEPVERELRAADRRLDQPAQLRPGGKPAQLRAFASWKACCSADEAGPPGSPEIHAEKSSSVRAMVAPSGVAATTATRDRQRCGEQQQPASPGSSQPGRP